MNRRRRTCTSALLAVCTLAACGGSRPPPEPVAYRGEDPAPAPWRPDESFWREPSGHLLDGVRQVSAGAEHTCALREDGTVHCWGDNSVGQLGDGTREHRAQPVRVEALPRARWVAAGARTTCAIAESETLGGPVYCWGSNSFGQLGNGETANGYTLPVRVVDLEATRLASSADSERTCAVTTGGSVACWGQLAARDAEGTPLLASRVPEVIPFRDAVDVAVGAAHECVLTARGRVLCRGLGLNGELGLGGRSWASRFTSVRGLFGARTLAAGAHHTCAVRHDGGVYCWGDNRGGQLGVDVPRVDRPVRLPVEVVAQRVVAGRTHTCVLGEIGSVVCLGRGGREGIAPAAEPQTVALDTRAAELSAGAQHTCAVLFGGALHCWGDNVGGQLGDGTAGDDRGYPVAVLAGV